MSVEVESGTLAEVATAVWRLQNKVGDEPISRYVRAVVDALASAGVETRRYDGLPFDSGLAIRVLAFQPTPGLVHEEIIETVRPAVFLNGSPIGMGEVIVGTPMTEQGFEQEDGDR